MLLNLKPSGPGYAVTLCCWGDQTRMYKFLQTDSISNTGWGTPPYSFLCGRLRKFLIWTKDMATRGQFHQHSTCSFCANSLGAQLMYIKAACRSLVKLTPAEFYYSVFHQFRQAKFDNGGSILSRSQF